MATFFAANITACLFGVINVTIGLYSASWRKENLKRTENSLNYREQPQWVNYNQLKFLYT